MFLCDTHLHTSFSSDSNTPMEDMILRGIELGLKILCFTEHHDFDFPDNAAHLNFQLDFDAYYRTFLQLKGKYEGKIELLHGIELGVMGHLGKTLRNFYVEKGGRYDFIINSCHLVDGMDPYEDYFFHEIKPEDALQKYFEAVYQNIQVYPYFQSAGHLDYITRYMPDPREEFHYEKYGEILDAILDCLIKKDKALEVNAAGLRHGLSWPHPHMEILKRYRELGGELITVGSDAHRPEEMAKPFEKVTDIIKEAGFTSYAVYRNQQPEFYKV